MRFLKYRVGACVAAAAHVRTGRVHQREVEMDVSLSVIHASDQQRRTRCEAWCEERARAADGDRAARRAMGVIVSTIHREKQGRVCERSGMEGSEASRSAAETNSLDRSSRRKKDLSDMHCTILLIAVLVTFFALVQRYRNYFETRLSHSSLYPRFDLFSVNINIPWNKA
jgi:hypothetical protein